MSDELENLCPFASNERQMAACSESCALWDDEGAACVFSVSLVKMTRTIRKLALDIHDLSRTAARNLQAEIQAGVAAELRRLREKQREANTEDEAGK